MPPKALQTKHTKEHFYDESGKRAISAYRNKPINPDKKESNAAKTGCPTNFVICEFNAACVGKTAPQRNAKKIKKYCMNSCC
jgi:hypothetical protein